MRNFIIFIISLYQKTLSPDHGYVKVWYPLGYCRYYPSCSEYAKKTYVSLPLYRAFLISVWRVARCTPWSGGGIDLPPQT